MKPIRQRAHAATLFALFWTLFSAGGIAGAVDSWRHGNRDYFGPTVALVTLVIHVISIVYAAHLWKTEKATPARGVSGFITDDLLDAKPEEINLEGDRTRLNRIIIGDIGSFVCLMFIAWLTHVKGLVGMGALFGSILFLHIVVEVGRYFILKRRTKTTSW